MKTFQLTDRTKEHIYYTAFALMMLAIPFPFYTFRENIYSIALLPRNIMLIASLGLFCILYLDKFISIIKNFNKTDFATFVFFCTSFVVVFFKTFETYVLILSAIYFYQTAERKKLTKITFYCVLSWILVWGILYGFNFIEHSKTFGFGHKNGAGMILYMIGVAIMLVLYEKQPIASIVSLFLIEFFTIKFFHCRTAFYSTVVFCLIYIFMFILNKTAFLEKHPTFDKVLSMLFKLLPLCMLILSVVLGLILQKHPIIDGAFCVRFAEIDKYFYHYPLRLFGNELKTVQDFNGTFIWGDNLYYRLVFEYGLVATAIGFVLSFFINKKIYDSKSPLLIALIVSFATYYTMEAACLSMLFIPIFLAQKNDI